MAFDRLRRAIDLRLRRIRGALGLGVTWAVGWAPIGALTGLVLGIVGAPPGVALWPIVQINAIAFAALGFVGGGLFSAVLSLAEGRRRFDQLSLPRFAALGAVGGLLLGGLSAALVMWGPGLAVIKVAAATVLGAVSATGTLALARRADDRELLEAGDEVADAGLSDEDRRHLLGGTA